MFTSLRPGCARLPALLLCASLASCLSTRTETDIKEVQIADGFTYQVVVEEGLAVVGIASAMAPLTEVDQAHFARLLHATLEEGRNLSVVTAEFVAQRLGSGAYDALLDGFRRTGELPAAHVESLVQSSPQTRYFALARIEGDFLERLSEADAQGPQPPMAGMPENEPAGERTERTVTVALVVYDAQTRAPALRSAVSIKQWNPVFFWNAGSDDPHPNAPDVEEGLEVAFKALIEPIPEA